MACEVRQVGEKSKAEVLDEPAGARIPRPAELVRIPGRLP